MESFELLMAYNCHKQKQREEEVKLAKLCSEIRREFYKNMPFHINVVSSAARGKLKEIAHSMILHDLLHHPDLLSSFLEEIIKIPGDTFCTADIRYPDQNRIDVSLVSRKTNKFLIIVNKVNNAEEQPGQLYRYVLNAQQQGFPISDVTVLYLNSDNYTPPSLYSRSKEGEGEEDDVYTIPVDMINIKNYKFDILNWLKSREREIDSNETTLKSALTQYIDYLEEYFQTKDKFKKLHDMTHKEIIKILGLENLSKEEIIKVLSSKIQDLDNLKSEIESLNRQLKIEKWNDILDCILQELTEKFSGRIVFRKFSNTVPEIGFDVKYMNSFLHVTLVYWTNGIPYWRIYGEKELDDIIRNGILQIIKPYFMAIKGPMKNGWDIFCETSKENCGLRICQLADTIMNSKEFTAIKTIEDYD